MSRIQQLAAIGVTAALTVSVGACSASNESAATHTATRVAESAAPTTAVTDGVTTIEDIQGPACSQFSPSGDGSAAGLADDPVATAVGHNPLLTTLAEAVDAAKLGDMLNGFEAVTVFAPIDPAFEAWEAENPGIIKKLTADPDAADPSSAPFKVLITHLVAARYDAEGLRSARTVASAQGSRLTIGGTAPDGLTVSSGDVTANVVCADVPTKNATVFLIDAVLLPAAS